MRVALLHAYSPQNSGDGLLVQDAMSIANEVCGGCASFDLFAVRDDDFSEDRDRFLDIFATKPSILGYSHSYLRALRRLSQYDLIIGVGGGYLRFGTPSEALKTWLIHVPQVLLASRQQETPVIYLPQSCGPLGPISKAVLRACFRRVDLVFLRDDRSLEELGVPNAARMPDCAILGMERRTHIPFGEDSNVVIGTRTLKGNGMRRVRQLARILEPVDGLLQSTVGSNSDFRAVSELNPQRILTQEELSISPRRRIVVSTRLHGALMAMAAGHYVVHLAYERKGYGAFSDLRMEQFVHSVFHLDPAGVAAQVNTLRSSAGARERYDAQVDLAMQEAMKWKTELLESVRKRVAKSLP